MFEIFIKGILIGLSISVPLGPIGMLCIQRTLNRGKNHGFVTGIGATTSDIVYAIITMFFLNFVLDIVEQHRLVIQIVGSIIIVIFGLWIYRSNPIAQPLPNEKKEEESSLFSDYFTSFGLTLSNPLILFVLIALFARIDFIDVETPISLHIFGLLSIVVGASVWWIFLTTLASKLRHRFNVRGLKIINRVTGAIIMIIGLIGAVSTFIN